MQNSVSEKIKVGDLNSVRFMVDILEDYFVVKNKTNYTSRDERHEWGLCYMHAIKRFPELRNDELHKSLFKYFFSEMKRKIKFGYKPYKFEVELIAELWDRDEWISIENSGADAEYIDAWISAVKKFESWKSAPV